MNSGNTEPVELSGFETIFAVTEIIQPLLAKAITAFSKTIIDIYLTN